MRRYDDLIQVDGAQTVFTEGGRLRIAPADEVYRWTGDGGGVAWPGLQERSDTGAQPQAREHEPLTELDPDMARRLRWQPSAYESAVHFQLNRLFSTRSGGRLRRVLTMPLTIMPFPIRDPIRRGLYRPNAAPRARAVDHSIYILYTPGHFPQMFRTSSLYHEFIHVLRIMFRVYRPNEVARNPDRFTSWEEWPAVCFENVLRSELNLPLRWGHYDLTTVLMEPTAWIGKPHNRQDVERLIQEMPNFTRAIAEIEVPFNPFRVIMRAHSRRSAVPRRSGPTVR